MAVNKVLITSPKLNHPGGVSNFTKLLLAASADQGFSYHFLPEGKVWLNSPKYLRPFEFAWTIVRFIAALVRVRPDLVHLNPSMNIGSLPLNLSLLWLAKAVPGSKVVVFFHGWDERIAAKMIEQTMFGRFLRRQLDQADHIMVLSPSFKTQLVKSGIDEEKITVTSTMVQFDRFDVSKGSGQRENEQPFSVLFASRLIRSKGVWVLIEAAEWWQQMHPDISVSFSIMGDGPEYDHLNAYIVEKKLQRLIRLEGHISGAEKVRLFIDSDLFLFPSTYAEGFPTVILEAMAAGLPVLFTPIGGVKYAFNDDNGSVVSLDDLSGEGVGKRILALYDDAERRMQIGARNRSIVRQEYDYITRCTKIFDVYQRLGGQAVQLRGGGGDPRVKSGDTRR